jgi:hypothetical protein
MYRRGVSLIEITAALVVVSLSAVLLTQLLVAAALQQRRAEQRAIAHQSAANLLEELLARPWEELMPNGATNLPLDAQAAELLPKALCTATIVAHASDGSGPVGKSVLVSVSWQDTEAGLGESVRLAGWRFLPGEP